MKCIPLHTVPKFFKECAEVLNEEWSRSLSARLHSLEKSCDEFPVCLVLLDTNSHGEEFVIAHSRLSNVQGRKAKSCLVESVVVLKSLRGKGYGRIIMQMTEDFARSKGFETMYLTTHDKQDFYQHLGYTFCSAVISLGLNSTKVPESFIQKLMGDMNMSENDEKDARTEDNAKKHDGISNKSTLNRSPESVIPPPPPALQGSPPPAPPPPPAPLLQTVAPPPPPGIPLPPPPPLSMKAEKNSSKDKTVTRWDPSLVSWMKKQLS